MARSLLVWEGLEEYLAELGPLCAELEILGA